MYGIFLSFSIALTVRPVARGVRRTTPNLPKCPLLATKWAKNGVFVGGLRGVRLRKSTFAVQKVHFCGVLHLPKIDPGYGSAHGIGDDGKEPNNYMSYIAYFIFTKYPTISSFTNFFIPMHNYKLPHT